MSRKIIVSNKQEMINLATDIAKTCKKGDIIGLKGTLGAGKTFFASAFINALSKNKTEVLSPTFNLVYSYPTPKGTVYHFDLYRIKDEEELYNIGIEDAFINGISLIEWPEIAKNFLKNNNYLEVQIDLKDSNSQIRLVSLT